MIVTLGQNGVPIDDKFIPDISVGRHWGRHWVASFYDAHYSERIKFEHNYPNYFPQHQTPRRHGATLSLRLENSGVGSGKSTSAAVDLNDTSCRKSNKKRSRHLPLAIGAYTAEEKQ
jgi:hypothetical protein